MIRDLIARRKVRRPLALVEATYVFERAHIYDRVGVSRTLELIARGTL
jgi:hypothetical protein